MAETEPSGVIVEAPWTEKLALGSTFKSFL